MKKSAKYTFRVNAELRKGNKVVKRNQCDCGPGDFKDVIQDAFERGWSKKGWKVTAEIIFKE